MDTNLVSSVMAMITKKLSPRAHRQTSAYTDLAHCIRASGLVERWSRRYVGRALVLAAGFAVGLWSLFALGNSWWQLLIAVGFGLLFTQTAFLAHDGAHRQIFTSGRWNEWASRILG